MLFRSLFIMDQKKTHSPDHNGQGNAFENAYRGTGMVSHRIGSGFWEGRAMRKRPVSIAILLLVLGFVLLYYTMQKQYMEFQNTCNQKVEEMRNTALLWESNGLLEDSFVSGTFCAESGTAQLYIEVSPVEKSEEQIGRASCRERV